MVIGRRGRGRWPHRTAWLLAGGTFLVLAVVLASGWRDLRAARSRLLSAKEALDQTTGNPGLLDSAAGRATTTRRLDEAIDEVNASRRIIESSWALRISTIVPGLSSQHAGLLRLVDDATTALVTGRTLLGEADALVVQGKVTGARVPIAPLASFSTDLRAAGTTMSGLNRPSGGLLGPLGKDRRHFDAAVASTGARLLNDADVLTLSTHLLGSDGERHYFVALENNAEMRDQGAILSYAVVTVDNGRVAVTVHGAIVTPIQTAAAGAPRPLQLARPAPAAIPPGTEAVFGSILPTQVWQSVNATADFDFSAQAIRAMYHQATGQSVDGVIALDVPALSALLDVVGPVTVPDFGEQITADDAGTVLLHDLYSSFPADQQAGRKELLSEVVTEVVGRLAAGSFDPLPLARQLAGEAAGGHLRLWSDVGQEETTIERIGLGGGPAVTAADRTFHLAVEDRNATKMDYYVRTSASQTIMITPTGTAIVRTTVSIDNGAPAGAAPSYQLGPDGFGTTQPGEYWGWVLLWGPSGSQQPFSVKESGLQLAQAIVPRIYAGQTRQVVFDTVIPHAVQDGKLELRYVPQPRLFPAALTVTVTAPGWNVGGRKTFAAVWDRTVTASWSLHK